MNAGLSSCRPKVILEMLEAAFPTVNVSAEFLLPSSKIGGLRLIESALLVSIVRLLDAQLIFEFGTFMGSTSVLLAKNSSATTRVFTVDISPEEFTELKAAQDTRAQMVDEHLRSESVALKAKCIDRSDQVTQAKITQILINSHRFSPKAYELEARCDLIFVDGGHDALTIDIDSSNALAMRSTDGAVVWHDYNSPTFTEVTEYLDEHPLKKEIVFIEDTLMAIYWPALNGVLRITP